MSLFLDGTCGKRGPKRKVRECLLCCEETLDPVICPTHTNDSCYCCTCIAQIWVESGRQVPQCDECGKYASNAMVRAALSRRDEVHRTNFATKFDRHQRFLHGDSELPVEGYHKKMCVCHNPPCKGTVSQSGKWITFRPAFKVPKVAWNAEKLDYCVTSRSMGHHLPICATCLAPAASNHIDLESPCHTCTSQTAQARMFTPLHHYINTLAGAKGHWTVPIRAHQVSVYNLLRHIYWILEDPNLFVQCPVDGTNLEHGDDCYELTCSTCKITKICFVCGRAEVTGMHGALVDHYGEDPTLQCCRYSNMYKWRLRKTDETCVDINYPCSSDCTSLDQRCDVAAHNIWQSYFTEWRRINWLVAFLREIPGNTSLVQMANMHPKVTKSKFVQVFTEFVSSI
jgi:hypothetical protein